LIEDKMFRLQVFKMGLTRTALESDHQRSYFTSREIRALFEWTDPAQGETRRLMLEKHGEPSEKEAGQAADEDGASEGWLHAGPAVGLSDLTLVFGSCTPDTGAETDVDIDSACNAKILAVREKLNAADEKLQSVLELRRAAEDRCQQLALEQEEAGAAAENLKARQSEVEDNLRKKRTELKGARRAEMSAEQHARNAAQAQTYCEDQLRRAEQLATQALEATRSAGLSVEESGNHALDSEDALFKAFEEVENTKAIVDDSGCAVAGQAVDVPENQVQAFGASLRKVKLALEELRSQQAQLHGAQDMQARVQLSPVEPESTLSDTEEARLLDHIREASTSADLATLNQDQILHAAADLLVQAEQRALAARDAVSGSLQELATAGAAFAGAFQKTQSRAVRADEVKAAQRTVKASLRRLQGSWQPVVKMREIWSKQVVQRKRAAQKAVAQFSQREDSKASLADAQREYQEASAEEALQKEARAACEQQLEALEEARRLMEAEDIELRKRRDEVKAALAEAKQEVKSAQGREKEVQRERRELHNECSKAEHEQIQMEEAKHAATRALESEEYDATQVEHAYGVAQAQGQKRRAAASGELASAGQAPTTD
jgi:hypothetical protein